MFQKGQLVQSRKYGDYYIVAHVYPDGYLLAQPLKNTRLDKFLYTADRLRLVGNNYRQKARK